MLRTITFAVVFAALSFSTLATPQQGAFAGFKSRHSISLPHNRVAQQVSQTFLTPVHVQFSTSTKLKNPTTAPINGVLAPSLRQLVSHFTLNNKIASGPTSAAENSGRLPTTVRPGLNEEPCTSSAECEGVRGCFEFDEEGDSITCAGGDCICLPSDNSCTTTADCDTGETCTELTSGATVCVSNAVLSGDTLDFETCTTSAECATDRSCFGTSLTSGLLDCSASPCSCVNIESNCDTFQDCLVGTACVRISPEIPASFCVANSLIVGNFPSGLTLSSCTTDEDCAGARECLIVDDAGEVVPCAGATGCSCVGGSNVGCDSSRFCDFGETCSSTGTDAFCNAVADIA